MPDINNRRAGVLAIARALRAAQPDLDLDGICAKLLPSSGFRRGDLRALLAELFPTQGDQASGVCGCGCHGQSQSVNGVVRLPAPTSKPRYFWQLDFSGGLGIFDREGPPDVPSQLDDPTEPARRLTSFGILKLANAVVDALNRGLAFPQAVEHGLLSLEDGDMDAYTDNFGRFLDHPRRRARR